MNGCEVNVMSVVETRERGGMEGEALEETTADHVGHTAKDDLKKQREEENHFLHTMKNTNPIPRTLYTYSIDVRHPQTKICFNT